MAGSSSTARIRGWDKNLSIRKELLTQNFPSYKMVKLFNETITPESLIRRTAERSLCQKIPNAAPNRPFWVANAT
ncbi:hypothetical protein GCM10011363_28400 [Marivita lacus]|uniref:Uncharacterized protein n=1 Tax=Marivita lacus TaxID=1323742 RepID=A0ABQ1KU11_9RHOB|nr:hypothetical protein [Marivita lacus]GGC10059.1 hypothetical protein GCM10011363_28400 [Marivita lacus]